MPTSNATLTLAEITEDIRALEEILGDIDPENAAELAIVEQEMYARLKQKGVKVDSIVYYIKSLEQRAAFQRDLADIHAQAATRLDKTVKRIKDYFVYLYEAGSIDKKITGAATEIRFQTNSQPSVEIASDDPQECLKQLYLSGTMDDLVEQEVKFSYKIKKDGLKQRMEDGRLPAAIIARVGSHMRTKANG